MINRNMRVLVLFDLPTATKPERREYAKFRKFLIKDGYNMLQFSVYSRITQNHDDANKHIERLGKNLPLKGSIRVLKITEKQYASMLIMLGTKTATENFLTPRDFIEL